ncbi:hypothetical protein QQF64_032542 [Cirrhinus molitorella]|uniref:Uncharacterized protein n=1 Tax=Cirrhinus molitorella TaxID=172907 RepID=A0ABR3N049_9TELE
MKMMLDMDGIPLGDVKDEQHTSAFVSLSLQPVYGAQHPPLDPRRHRPLKDAPKASSVNTKSKKPSTFHEFARSTNDAWDIDDEEDDSMFSLKQPSSSPVQSRSMPQTPCLKLIKASEPLPHSQESIGTNPDQERLDVESGPANGRVVKSCSDAQLNVNAVGRQKDKTAMIYLPPWVHAEGALLFSPLLQPIVLRGPCEWGKKKQVLVCLRSFVRKQNELSKRLVFFAL